MLQSRIVPMKILGCPVKRNSSVNLWYTCLLYTSTDNSEFADDIRSMASEGYQVIMTWEDNVSQAALNLADEIYKNYPCLLYTSIMVM